ncbi:outer membrane lipoprotein-sorting protein [Ideonella sp. 4Y11]|uniref:Outer membrane lipoprotein-sorting protein n=1 Tax=Ideonella aquatica TaxID=2824119 RepID=A0A940YG95_9BURK|nr:outer membrane lipoprotein-sorting protein [Ideonella aquatica]MBQ0959585.1 outer membrane lipoprotein-sorting protein [Ideonella aquatica]
MKAKTLAWIAAGALVKIGLLAGLAWHSATRAAEPDVPALLQAADRFRTGAERLQVETLVTTTRADGSADKERRYTVFVQDQHRSLVLMRSPAEAGQKVLMLGDDFWLLMPGSQRAMRITPSQKLLGDASTGDIATLSWAEDYDGRLVGEERCEAEGPARPCLHLTLQARRKGVSYQRIELWLGKPRHEPVRAELYVQSDKLAKRARFVLDHAGTLVSEMRLQDELGSRAQTRVQYLSRQPRAVPENWLNPMFLARNPSLE